MSFLVEKDGIGLKGVLQRVIVQYSPGWRKINSMCLCDGKHIHISISHCHGISKINLDSGEYRLLVELEDQPCVLKYLVWTSYLRIKRDLLFGNLDCVAD